MDERKADAAREAASDFEEATRDSYKAAVDHAFEVQKGGMHLSRRFFENWLETMEDQAELNRRTLEGLRELVRAHSKVYDEASRDSLDAYDGFLNSLSDYHEEVAGVEHPKD